VRSGYKGPFRGRVETDVYDRFELSSNAETWVTIELGIKVGDKLVGAALGDELGDAIGDALVGT
jgi:hypothetical protein